MLNRIMATAVKKNNKKLFVSLLSLLLIVGVLSLYSWMIPESNTTQSEDETPKVVTTYDYKAMVTPNVLHPNGGTVEVGDTLYRKITTAIPFDLKSVISAGEQMLFKGTYDVQLLITAGENWNRTFPIQAKQNLERKGTNISLFDISYQIDLDTVEAFIHQVEKETGVKHFQYELEIVPTIQGVIDYSGKVFDVNLQDKLRFNYLSDEIILASEKSFSTAIQPDDGLTAVKPVGLFGLALPLLPVRIMSTSFFILLLVSILFSLVYLDEGPLNAVTSEAERISKKYGRRVIPISQQVDVTGKTIVHFARFSSMLKIADDIEQPIFFYENDKDHSQIYLIVDLFCVYSYAPNTDIPPARPIKDFGNKKEYAVS